MSVKPDNVRPSGPMPLNPERVPALLGKYSKMLGKELESFDIKYTTEGVSVKVTGMPGTNYASLKNASLAEYKALKAKESLPTHAEALQAFKNKFELRLNQEFPEKGPTSGKPEDIQTFIQGLPFRQRRALMMTQKQFASQYPNGYTQA